MADSRKFDPYQQITQIGVKLVASGTWPYWLVEFLPQMVIPYKSMFELSCVPIASVVVDEAYALVYQADPIAHWRALGNGNPTLGVTKLASVRGIGIGTMLVGGYVMSKYSMTFIPKLAQSHNPVAHFLAEVLIIPSYRQAALGLISYGSLKAVTVLGLAIWNYFSPKGEKAAGTWDEPHLMQRCLGYTVRLLLTIPMAETLFYYLTDQNVPNLAANWRFQMAAFTTLHAALWTADNYAARPESVPERDIEADNQPVQRGMRWKYIVPAAMMATAYVLSEGMCAYMNLLENKSYCQKNTLGARMGRFAVQVGLPVASYYAITDFIPRSNISIPRLVNSCHTLFRNWRSQPSQQAESPNEDQALLANVVAGK